MIKSNSAIRVNNLKKTFRIPKDKSSSIKGHLLGRSSRGYNEFTPLNGISFDVNKGDFFGIVGRNGSGKSTLLRTIAGVYAPTSGAVHINGTLIPFIELGVGFNPQLTGRENVYLNAALLGFSRKEVDAMYDDIVEFAELKDFMEERLQNYSSGMQVRLAFSIAIRAETDILLLDEVLAVGDTAFQEKCFDYFRQLKNEERTVVLVTHNMNHVREFCNRGLVLEDGKIAKIGSSDEVADTYEKLFIKNKKLQGTRVNRPRGNTVVHLDSVKLTYRKLENDSSQLDIKIDMNQIDRSYENFNVSIEVRNQQDLLIFSNSSAYLTGKHINFNQNKSAIITFTIKDTELGNGTYYLNVEARANKLKEEQRKIVFKEPGVASFVVEGHMHNKYSIIHPLIESTVQGANTKKIKNLKPVEEIKYLSN